MFRFAPSPTGDMHIGNLRVALINFVSAKKENKQFILRIEDTDTARNIEGKEEDIKKILTLFGISWDAYYIQSNNLHIHRQLANQLLKEKKAFKCYCTEEQLQKKKEEAKNNNQAYRYDGTCENKQEENKPYVIRLKKPSTSISFTDEIKGQLSFQANDIDSFVILRQDLTPTYNFACTIDDMSEAISFIIRGEDHTSNTPKQLHIRNSLNYNEEIKFAHLPIILNEEGKKISKREAHSSVQWLLDNGYLPSAIANYLLSLGNKCPKEIFTLQEAISFFDVKNISKSPAKFDIDRLKFINREHIKMLDDELLVKILFKDEFLANFTNYKNLAKLAKLYTQEADTLIELSAKLAPIFLPKNIIFKENEDFLNPALKIEEAMLKADTLPLNYDEFKKDFSCGLKGKELFMSLRLLLSASAHGPELNLLYEAIAPIFKDIVRLRQNV
ncbi:glutamate--tRNA ligase [Campylobacter canadensis]|uniref:Glutamate--tRNA ligase n=1 Tax=Campylobacter canadensis TaxID=449520 RepID=A0ABS7WQH8_9BACT|nr:glutamate--tRNA ligase [Campylobacter canadensis]MBZ7987014.1 glutamate--tRNA ligase [Campylobacter canadensis]MBZ7994628.1 glutamate--tRNA ligase [Campylobacter canadensis]MBZ7996124.1 glutamate--tRNA ligase [Campylobacter canadensis]MBZ7998050.1 glutamate--tRNA ligase [Campylobacter canadensis]MBZ8000060.1 glutamate--tRNA ligase [Campylobacter canadensis]